MSYLKFDFLEILAVCSYFFVLLIFQNCMCIAHRVNVYHQIISRNFDFSTVVFLLEQGVRG